MTLLLRMELSISFVDKLFVSPFSGFYKLAVLDGTQDNLCLKFAVLKCSADHILKELQICTEIQVQITCF
jgi:hypothetical protein